MAYDSLFQPIKVGGVTLKNRVVLCAMGGTNFFGHVGGYTPGIRDFYIERCKGGVGLIIPGAASVKSGDKYLYEEAEYFRTFIKDTIEEIHSYGTKYFMQLSAGFGRVELGAINPNSEKSLHDYAVAPADGLENFWMPHIKHRGLTKAELDDLVDAFGKSALLCKEAGIDGVELHAVHEGYLLDQFAIASMNGRTDEYGGSLENRMRFTCDIIREIKRVCGEDYPVSVRYSVSSKIAGFHKGVIPGEDYNEFGRSLEESPAAARILEAAGCDMLNADNGTYDSWWWAHPPVYMPLACNFPEVSYLKKFVNIPVFCAGRMEDPEFSAQAVASGQIDGIGVARQFLTDPHWLTKAQSGKCEDIKPCIACHNACFPISLLRKPNSPGVHMSHCALNPACLDEKKWEITPAAEKKNIAVVGGGIGGMECAQLLAQRGHKVTLFEKTNDLGGAFIAAAAPSFKEKDKMLLSWYARQVNKTGVDVRLNTEATEEMLKDFDEVVIATGATPRKLPISGLDNPKVMEAVSYLRGQDVGDTVAIIGGGLTGVEIAYDLVLKGKKPIIVEMQKDILQVFGLCIANSELLRGIIRVNNIEVHCNAALAKVEGTEKLTVTVNTPDGEQTISADNVILSVGYVSDKALADKLDGEHVHVIGDAKEVGNLMSVIKDAYELAFAL